MKALLIILAIFAAIVFILYIKVGISAEFDKKLRFVVHYMGFKIPLYPREPKKDKKAKPEKKTEEAAPAEEAKKEKPAKTKQNPIKTFIDNQGFYGVIDLLSDSARILGGFFGSLFKHMIIDDLFLKMYVAGSDAADTAIKYGKVCSAVFPSLGKICSSCHVKRYNAEINPDFLAETDEAEFYVRISMRPLLLIWAVLVLAVKILFKVVIKLFCSKPQSSTNKINQGGAK